MPSRFFALLFFLLIPAVSSLHAAETGGLDASEPLFTVLAAANAIGYDAGLQTSPPLRRQVRDHIAETHAPVIAELRAWYKEHPAPDKTADLSRFITLGLSIKGAPDFDWSKREVEVPPDAREMDDFRKLLPRFYQEAKIDDLWRQSQPAIDAILERFQEPIAHAILEANSYLRNPTSGFLGRRFQIYIDVLGAPNQIQARSFGDDYFLVFTPSPDPHDFEVRHAYLRYLIDPLAIKYGMQLKEKASLMDIAEAAPLLPEYYRSDFGLLATECLIKAIESRLTSNPSMVDRALHEGYILAPFFNDQLAVYEKQPDSMKLFFPKMVAALNVKHEVHRLQNVRFDQTAEQPAVTKVETLVEPPKGVAAGTIAEADDLYYGKKDLESARMLYERALEQPGSNTDHARSFYGLARIALLQKDPEKADQLFRKTLQSSPDAETQAWTCYYLGRLSTLATGGSDEAGKWFAQALAVPGAPPETIASIRKKIDETPAPENNRPAGK